MSLNIQNFSQLTDINISNKIKIIIDLKVFNVEKYELLINNQPVTGSFEVDLLDAIDIVINKTSGGLIDISSITINDYEIMPKYLSYSTPSTNNLTKDVTWHLSITPNFYTWYHNITGQGWIA